MNISVFGLGYVGAVSLACLARDGHRVIGVDIEQAKLDLIRAGRTPVVEEGLVQLMAGVVASGRVSVTDDAREAVGATELSFVSVGTPSAANGSQDQRGIVRLAGELGNALREKKGPHVIVFRSTLTPGTVEQVLRPVIENASGKRDGAEFHLCFQPEFLREGSSIADYDKPPYTIVGANADAPATKLRGIFGHLPCEFFRTSVRTAEMLKYCCNNFHAVKITFANETARLCDALGVDPFEVMDLLCRDTQLNISKAYLKPGFAFGGSCLPKDLRATLHLGREKDVEIPMLDGVLSSNQRHVERAIAKVMESGCRRIGMIGLSFKGGTDDLRESPLVALAEHFIGKGLQVLVYDPEVHLSNLLGANRQFIERHLPHIGALLRSDLSVVIAESELLVVGLNSTRLATALAEHARPDQIVLDLVRLPNREKMRANYQGLCWQ